MLRAVDLQGVLERHGLRDHRRDVRKIHWHGGCGTHVRGILEVEQGLVDIKVRDVCKSDRRVVESRLGLEGLLGSSKLWGFQSGL